MSINEAVEGRTTEIGLSRWALPGVVLASGILFWISPSLSLAVPVTLAAAIVLPNISWKQLFVAYLGVLLLIPSDIYRLPITLPFDLQPDRVLFMLILVLWVSVLLIDPKTHLGSGPTGRVLVIFLLIATVSQLANFLANDTVWFDAAIKRLVYLTSFVLGFFFIGSVFGRREIESILKWLVVLGGVVALFGVVERLWAYNVFEQLNSIVPLLKRVASREGLMYRGGARIFASSEHPIAVGTLMAMLLPLAVHFWARANKTVERLGYGAIAGFMLAALIFTESRSGVLTLLASAAMWLAFRRPDLGRIVPFLLIALVIINSVEPKGLQGLDSVFFPKGGISKEGSVMARLEDYASIRRQFAKAPLLGVGFDMFDPRRHFFIDNQYLKFAVEIGALGLLALAALFGSIVLNLRQGILAGDRSTRDLLVALLSSIIGFIVVSAFFDSFGFHQARSLFFILSALGLKYAADTHGSSVESREPAR